MTDTYVVAIMALLPLSALMLIIQTSPYQALVMRGILGAIAALIYALLGGADVALTEALVGTMLAITLYAVAVRSSLVMRLGVLKGWEVKDQTSLKPLLGPVRQLLNRHHLRLELVPYADLQALHQALLDKEVHGTCLGPWSDDQEPPTLADSASSDPYLITLRVARLFDLFTLGLPPDMVQVKYLSGEDEPLTQAVKIAPLETPQS
ncbi:MAG TPA: DUF4040 domain-containing protein [Leptolyngbyaceae cyanobacterium M65_K2018_010]|nr:DUF4040 domain-containing protein [Leptolyngbyaceae cyanobacterium M65_K2018_010]